MTIDTTNRVTGALFGTPMIDVTSSNVGRVGYSFGGRPACDGTLYVQFRDKRANDRNGTIYAYDDVPYAVYTELVAQGDRADGSVGKAFHRLVKSVGYGYRKIS